jgi:toxin ParE1/3/4
MYAISRKATEDLEQIWVYTYFQWSEQQADKYYNSLIEKIEFLAKNVFAGHKIDYIIEGYRCYAAMQHLIFYTVLSDETINIIRILHKKMDIPNRLLEDIGRI